MGKVQREVVDTIGGSPVLMRLCQLGRDSADSRLYHYQPAGRSWRRATVQITLSGAGAVWREGRIDRYPEGWDPIPVGKALVFISGEDRIEYGVIPGGDTPWDFIFVELEGEGAILAVRDLIARHGPVLALGGDQMPRTLLGLLPRSGTRYRMLNAVDSAQLAWDVLRSLLRGNDLDQMPSEDAMVSRAMLYLRERLDQTIGLDEVARHCHVSREHLSRTFTRRCGEPPARWIKRQRLQKVEELLQSSQLTLGEIAGQCGFCSASHLVQAFRAFTGQTPARWRQSRA